MFICLLSSTACVCIRAFFYRFCHSHLCNPLKNRNQKKIVMYCVFWMHSFKIQCWESAIWMISFIIFNSCKLPFPPILVVVSVWLFPSGFSSSAIFHMLSYVPVSLWISHTSIRCLPATSLTSWPWILCNHGNTQIRTWSMVRSSGA